MILQDKSRPVANLHQSLKKMIYERVYKIIKKDEESRDVYSLSLHLLIVLFLWYEKADADCIRVDTSHPGAGTERS